MSEGLHVQLRFGSILIVTYGRSGSTLLQGMLNTIPGVLVRGENHNLCFHLFQAYRSLRMAKEYDFAPDRLGTPRHPWYGNTELDEERFLRDAAALVRHQLLEDEERRPAVTCYGFKEIRYTRKNVGDRLVPYLEFLARIFPNPAFVFNKRDLEQVKRSGWWRDQDREEVEELLRTAELEFDHFVALHPNNACMVSYADMVGKTDRLRRLFEFLGAGYDEARIDRALGQPHSSH